MQNFPLPVSRGFPHFPPPEKRRCEGRPPAGGLRRAQPPWATGGGEGRPRGAPPQERDPEPRLQAPSRPSRRAAGLAPDPRSGSAVAPPAPSPRRPDPRLGLRAPHAAGLGGRQRAPALPRPRLLRRTPTPDPGPPSSAPGRQPGRPHLRHSPPPPSPPPPPSSSILRPLPLPASPRPAGEGPRAEGAASAERAGGRTAPAARGPGRRPGLLRPGGALALGAAVT